jgi:hypothetical protein
MRLQSARALKQELLTTIVAPLSARAARLRVATASALRDVEAAYLRIYVGAGAIEKLAALGIRGAIELGEVRKILDGSIGDGTDPERRSEHYKALVAHIADILGTTPAGARYFIDQMHRDHQVNLLANLWGEMVGA